MAAVEIFPRGDPWIAAKPVNELVGADVEGKHAPRAPLEQAIRKPAGRGAHVQTYQPRDVDAEGVQGAFELQSAAADEAGLFLDLDRGLRVDFFTGFGGHAGADLDLAGQNRPLGLLPRGKQPARCQKLVETHLQNSGPMLGMAWLGRNRRLGGTGREKIGP